MIRFMVLIVVLTAGLVVGSPELPKGDICLECEQVLGTIHLILSNNETETEVLSAMNQVCKMLPQEYASICTEAVSLYGRQLIDALVKYLAQPQQFCSLIGLCNSTKTAQREAFEFLQDLRVYYAHKGIKIFNVKTVEMSDCAICEFIMDLVQTTMADKPMVEFFNDALVKLCAYLPKEIQPECQQIITVDEPQWYAEFVKKYLDPINFCTGVEVCPKV